MNLLRRRRAALRALAPFASLAAAMSFVALVARADSVLPPWVDPGDVPLPEWARSVAPLRNDTPLVVEPGHPEMRRGTVSASARLPLYGAKRASGCEGRWLLVGPLAWVCSDVAELSRDAERAPPRHATDDGAPYRYFAVGPGGAEAFLNRPAGVDAPEETLDPGFAVAVAEEREVESPSGTRKWARTTHGKWIAMSELVAFRPSRFHGEDVEAGALDFAWVAADVAFVYPGPAPRGRPVAKHARFDRVAWREERAAPAGGGAMVRVSEDGAGAAQWMRARDLAHPSLSAPPDQAGGPQSTQRWVDVDATTQTLVAYQGATPVFATLVSTGRGDGATPDGIFRVRSKARASDLDDLADEDDEEESARASVEDAPYVQRLSGGVTLFGAFWHRDFGRPHGRGAVNLTLKDAATLFAFTWPHVPAAWESAAPTDLEPGTVVRVRGAADPAAFPLDPAHKRAMHEPGAAGAAGANAPSGGNP